MTHRRKRLGAALAAALGCSAAQAVNVGADGMGQALIYPYYTARAVEGGQLNTYISVVNHTVRAKAVRLTVREGRMARVVANLNVFLSPNDVWTGAIVPDGEGARLVTSDTSCVEPARTSFEFHDRDYSGANADGAGTGLERTREGYLEILEMATLTGATAAAVTHTSAGLPSNCAAVQAPLATGVEAPSGGLSGTLTVIDVQRGFDFTVNAEALDNLARSPYYRPASDLYPGFGAGEIERVSTVVHNGFLYRSEWAFSVDAVSAVLMRNPVFEYTLEEGTRSATDVVMTLPTRHLHANAQGAGAPFIARAAWSPRCRPPNSINAIGEPVLMRVFNREERTTALVPDSRCGFAVPVGSCEPHVCAASAVGTLTNGAPHLPPQGPSPVLGSRTGGFYAEVDTFDGRLPFRMGGSLPAGWFSISRDFGVAGSLVSLQGSTRVNLATGEVLHGSHTYRALPTVGFAVRTFLNGTLDCGGAPCQGNFGGAFPFRYTRSITP